MVVLRTAAATIAPYNYYILLFDICDAHGISKCRSPHITTASVRCKQTRTNKLVCRLNTSTNFFFQSKFYEYKCALYSWKTSSTAGVRANRRTRLSKLLTQCNSSTYIYTQLPATCHALLKSKLTILCMQCYNSTRK